MSDLDQFNQAAIEVGGNPQYRGILLTVHGLNTTGKWQKDLSPIFQMGGYLVVGIDYGFKRLSAVFFPRRVLKRATKEIQKSYGQYHRFGRPISVIAHSFGTLAIAEHIDSTVDARFHRVILTGSIVRRGYPWNEKVAGGQIVGLLNEVSENDVPVGLCRLLRIFSPTLPVGPSGKGGFVAVGAELGVIERRHKKQSHSEVLNSVACHNAWLPFLENGSF